MSEIIVKKKVNTTLKPKKNSISVTSVVICLHIVIFVLDQIQKGGLVYCTMMKNILNVYSGKEAGCIAVFLQAVNI